MPEKARVFIAEDNPDFSDNLRMVLESSGHTVTLSATSLENALSAVENFKNSGIQVAVLDGNLQRGVRSGADGQKLITTIRRIAPSIKIVGMSSEPMSGVDIDLGKNRFEELGNVVTTL